MSQTTVIAILCLWFTTVESTIECNTSCGRIYAPICIMDDFGNLKTIANECIFNYLLCSQSAKLKLIYRYPCELGINKQHYLQCHKICANTKELVCAVNKAGHQVTFQNLCYFDVAQCQFRTDDWYVIHNGSCKVVERLSVLPLRDPCTEQKCYVEYKPVCVENYFTGAISTFGNKCLFERHMCQNPGMKLRILYNGTCDEYKEAHFLYNVCLRPCRNDYVPLCAQDIYGNLRTFANRCLFDKEFCHHPATKWKIIYYGECMPKSVLVRLNVDPDGKC